MEKDAGKRIIQTGKGEREGSNQLNERRHREKERERKTERGGEIEGVERKERERQKGSKGIRW